MNSSPLALNLHIDNWGVSPISDNAIFIKDGTHGTHKRVSKGIPLLSAKNITPSGKIYWDSEDSQVSDDDYYKIHSKYELAKSDLLLTVVGTLGRSALVTGEGKFTIQRSVAVIRINQHKVLPSFIYQFCSTDFFQKQLELRSNATAQAGVYLGELAKIPLPVPPLPEQQKIAAILTSVDDVIEKTQAQINKLKDLKTGMMQELLTRGVGVDGKPHTEFKNSPVGRIPKGWDVLPLAKVAKLERGKFSHRPRNDPAFYNGDYPFLQTGDIPKSSPYITSYSQSLNDKGLKVSKLFKRGTLVITIAATIGEIGILNFDSCFPDSLVGISVDEEKADRMYILYVMRYLKSELDALAPQSAQKNINLDILNPFEIPVPSIEEQKKIAKSLAMIDERILILDKALQTKKELKKALMQDLLTGKVRVNVG